jgi:small subunit ribosomal protein S4
MLMKGERCLGAKCGAVRRGTRPGMHGKARRRQGSEFGLQLAEKQKIRYSYGLSNTGLEKVFEEASNMPGRTSDGMMQILERRLDNVVFRSGFVVSRGIARKLVSHGHILVNGKRVTVPSYRVRPGEVISIREGSKDSPMFAELGLRLKKYESPAWIELNADEKIATIRALPKEEELRSERNLRLVVEFYSK